MVRLGLFIKAELDGVTALTPVDTLQNPFFYTFKVMCNSCHEVNDNWITISRQVQKPNARKSPRLTIVGQEKVAMTGSRGDAHFVWKCKNCRVCLSVFCG